MTSTLATSNRNGEPTRRQLMNAAAWSVPVIAVAVATPLAAASRAPATLRNALHLTNVTATVGRERNAIYFNTTVMVADSEPVENVVLVVTLSRGGKPVTRTWPLISAYGNGGRVDLTFPGIPKGEPVLITATASAPGVKADAGQAEVVTPAWWS